MLFDQNFDVNATKIIKKFEIVVKLEICTYKSTL